MKHQTTQATAKIIFAALLTAGLSFTACEKDDNDGGASGNNSYWGKSILVQMQLKGKVKSIKEDNENGYSMTNFDQAGRLTSEVSHSSRYWNGSAYVDTTITTTLTYNSAGQLTNDGYHTYTYASHGKLIPRGTFHLYEAGLVPNLKSMTSSLSESSSTVDYVFNGDKLQILSTSRYGNDTVYVTYQGIYPVACVDTSDGWGTYFKASYAANGMFSVYEEGFIHGAEPDRRIYTFKADDEYLLLERSEMGRGADKSIATFAYNDKKDLIREEYSSGSTTYTYEYDSQNNWTKKTTSYSTSPENSYVEEREITYW